MFRPGLMTALLATATMMTAGFAQSADMEARALLKSRNNAELSAEIEGLIKDIPFRPGQAFKKGQTLASFDCRFYQERLAVSQAELEAAKATLESRQILFKRKAASKLQLALAEAEVAKASAETQSSRLIVQRCSIRAPYAGRVVEWLVDKHEYVTAGKPLLSILDDGNWEVRILAQSSWLKQLKVGTAFKLRLDETGKVYEGQIARIGAKIEPQSQTIEVFGLLTKSGQDLISGMSGVVLFDSPTQ